MTTVPENYVPPQEMYYDGSNMPRGLYRLEQRGNVWVWVWVGGAL